MAMIITCCHCGTKVEVEDEDEAKELGWTRIHGKFVCPHCVWKGGIMEDEKCL